MSSYLLACVLAIALHELAHIALARACGLRVKRVGISWIGPYLVREQGTAAINFCVTLAGPVTNLVLAAVFWSTAPLFAQVNLILGAYNLLPFIPQTDGRRAWNALRSLLNQNKVSWSGRRDLNPGPLAPQASALARLRHGPKPSV